MKEGTAHAGMASYFSSGSGDNLLGSGMGLLNSEDDSSILCVCVCVRFVFLFFFLGRGALFLQERTKFNIIQYNNAMDD